tara:strand:+ start:410 stop:793 length:384 start_codon:yes stop_codon:yes gene_type:complete
MSFTKPTIYDNTHFDLEIVSPMTSPINPVGIVTGFTNPIYGASWILTGVHTTGVGVTYTLSIKGEHYLSPPDSGNYVEYNNVTRDTVKGWIEGTEPNIVHKYTICNTIQEMIDKKTETDSQSLPSGW